MLQLPPHNMAQIIFTRWNSGEAMTCYLEQQFVVFVLNWGKKVPKTSSSSPNKRISTAGIYPGTRDLFRNSFRNVSTKGSKSESQFNGGKQKTTTYHLCYSLLFLPILYLNLGLGYISSGHFLQSSQSISII